ncbi:hypothetical protein [Terracidiphilus gabretensis]|nr:hypothetical protein [Terracidiphilus gabretensis]
MADETAPWMGQPAVVVELTKGKSKNNRRSFDSFRAERAKLRSG